MNRSNQCRVLHITDTLNAGGQEGVAVNLVNGLPRAQFLTFFCATRGDGPLLGNIASDVPILQLQRRHTVDSKAIKALVAFIRENDIQILHAHGYSLFVAIVASFFSPFPAVVWHIHSGELAQKRFVGWLYSLVGRRIQGVIAVNQALAEWACKKVHLDADRVWYVPNFVTKNITENSGKVPGSLPGEEGGRIVCLANLRPQKDHITLLNAMRLVTQKFPKAHLLLVGSQSDKNYLENILEILAQHRLQKCVSLLGHKKDAFWLLQNCDIGVLSSSSEGFPMVLLEYGMAGLPVVATNVGQCSEILDHGGAGILVSPEEPDQLAEALLALLLDLERRKQFGGKLKANVQEKFNQTRILERYSLFYEMVLKENGRAQP